MVFGAALIIGWFTSELIPRVNDQDFWLPRERLVFKGSAPFTGYVLKSDEDRLVILNDEPRLIIELPKRALEGRDLCYPAEQGYEEAFKEAGHQATICP